MFEISKLKEKKLSELQEIAEELKISKYKTLKKLDLVYKILDHQASNPDEKDSDKKLITTQEITEIASQKVNQMVIEILEIDIKNQTLSLMQLSKVKVFLI